MTSHIADRGSTPFGAPTRTLLTTPSCRSKIIGDSMWAQLFRFALVGGSSNILYVAAFVGLASAGSFTANIVGVAASTVLANELHRRLTFHAAGRVGWFEAQWEGGALALVGLGVSTLALAAVHLLLPGVAWPVQVLAVITVSALTGALRFVALRGWVF